MDALAPQAPRIPSPQAGGDAGPEARVMPHNLEAEQAVLGAILFNNEIFEDIAEFLQPKHFFEPLHGRIFGRAAELIRKGLRASIITIASAMADDPGLKEVNGQAYLKLVTAASIAAPDAKDYAKLLYDLALKRELIIFGDEVRHAAFDRANEMNAEDQIEHAEGQLYSLAEHGNIERGLETAKVAFAKAIEIAESAYRNSGRVSGLSTGLRDLDARLGGLNRSDLIVLAARPGMGKTSLATNIAFNIARARAHSESDGGVVGFFTLEMSSEQLAWRILSEQTEIPSQNIRKGLITQDDFRKLARASSELERLPLFIDQTGAIPIATLAARARRHKRRFGLDFLVVDYLQLMSGSARRGNENRVQEISEITKGLKALAKDLDVPILALSQLSRAVEQRENKRPMLSDLRESGSIEQDADIVLFIYREAYYRKSEEPPHASSEWDAWQAKMEEVHGRAEVLIEKHRHGPTGVVSLAFAEEFTRFGNLERTDYEVR